MYYSFYIHCWPYWCLIVFKVGYFGILRIISKYIKYISKNALVCQHNLIILSIIGKFLRIFSINCIV
jgi:hypothetical protein